MQVFVRSVQPFVCLFVCVPSRGERMSHRSVLHHWHVWDHRPAGAPPWVTGDQHQGLSAALWPQKTSTRGFSLVIFEWHFTEFSQLCKCACVVVEFHEATCGAFRRWVIQRCRATELENGRTALLPKTEGVQCHRTQERFHQGEFACGCFPIESWNHRVVQLFKCITSLLDASLSCGRIQNEVYAWKRVADSAPIIRVFCSLSHSFMPNS